MQLLDNAQCWQNKPPRESSTEQAFWSPLPRWTQYLGRGAGYPHFTTHDPPIMRLMYEFILVGGQSRGRVVYGTFQFFSTTTPRGGMVELSTLAHSTAATAIVDVWTRAVNRQQNTRRKWYCSASNSTCPRESDVFFYCATDEGRRHRNTTLTWLLQALQCDVRLTIRVGELWASNAWAFQFGSSSSNSVFKFDFLKNR